MSKKVTSFDRNPTFSGHVKIDKDESQYVSSGEPLQADNKQFVSEDGKLICGSWECKAGVLQLTNYAMDEYCMLRAGELVITDEKGNSTTHKAGDSFVIPRGFTGVLDMKTTISKDYVIYL